MSATLHEQPAFAQTCPVRGRQAVGLNHRNGKAWWKMRVRFPAHSVASEPRRRLLTGVTIGPPMTMATSFRFTWFVDVPRTWRTASSTKFETVHVAFGKIAAAGVERQTARTAQ